MRVFDYRPEKAAMAAILLAAFAYGSYAVWQSSGSILVLLFGIVTAVGAAKLAYDCLNQTPAIRFDRHSLWVRKSMGAAAEVPWRDVHGIKLMVFTVRYLGIIPVGRTEYVEIASEGGLFGAQRLRVPASTMRLPPGGARELVLILQAAHVEAVGVAGAAMAGAGKTGWGIDSSPAEEPATNFDPDAALARYLATKEAEAQRNVQVAPAAPARAALPPRPVFGRKAS